MSKLCAINNVTAATVLSWWGRRSSRPCTQAELEAIRALRSRLRQVWLDNDEREIEIVNHLLRETGACPQLVKDDDWDLHLYLMSADQSFADWMAAAAAMAFVEVICAGERARLRKCAAADCGDVFVDFSRNRPRLFCGKGCGNKANVAAYRARQRLHGLPASVERAWR
jgi:predicted RNA-binding Zn ribbon-like protein